MTSENERRLILEMIQSGKISADEGLRLLKAVEADLQSQDEPALGEGAYDEPAGVQDLAQLSLTSAAAQEPSNEAAGAAHDRAAEPDRQTPASSMPDMAHWRRMWTIPLWVGVGVTVFSSVLMYLAQRANGIGFLFFCTWLPFLLGLTIMILAFQSRSARWLHIRIQQRQGEWPQNIAISFPIPIGLTSWFLRNFKHKIRGLEHTSVDELITALGSSTAPENPLYVEVNEGEDGEKVQIYIG